MPPPPFSTLFFVLMNFDRVCSKYTVSKWKANAWNVSSFTVVWIGLKYTKKLFTKHTLSVHVHTEQWREIFNIKTFQIVNKIVQYCEENICIRSRCDLSIWQVNNRECTQGSILQQLRSFDCLCTRRKDTIYKLTVKFQNYFRFAWV